MHDKRDLVDVIEAAYAVEQDEAAWLDGVVGAAAPLLDCGLGVMGVTLDLSDDRRFVVSETTSRGLTTETVALVKAALTTGPQSIVESILRGPVTCASEVMNSDKPMEADFLVKLGAASRSIDGHGVVGRGPSGRFVVVSVPTSDVTKPSPAFRTRWSRVAAHLATGLRLQQRLAHVAAPPKDQEPLDAADAILEPNGKLAHALGEAKGRSARKALRDAARSMDRARGSLRGREPDDAVAAWRALVNGRWSLVDHFDRDGRRYLIARPNAPGTRAHAALTEREREVVSYAALGHANKLIAYELGLPESTVSTELSRAAKKLGARSRLELVRMFAAGR
jgi:DNA-binding CsgD family transcriptional regulator